MYRLLCTDMFKNIFHTSSSLRPGSKAFTHTENINGNETKFSTQLGFDVLNILSRIGTSDRSRLAEMGHSLRNWWWFLVISSCKNAC